MTSKMAHLPKGTIIYGASSGNEVFCSPNFQNKTALQQNISVEVTTFGELKDYKAVRVTAKDIGQGDIDSYVLGWVKTEDIGLND